MGAQGCVSWSFDRKGVIVIDNEDGELDEDTVMMDALDAGAEDFSPDGPVCEITTDPDSFNDVVKALEEKGIGRPSTYAPIITTIVDRGYVEKDQKKLKTTPLGQAVNTVMMEQFPNIVDVKFSADMEKKLDIIEAGKADWVQTIDDFYKGFAKSLEDAEKNMEGKRVKVEDIPTDEICEKCGRPMVIKSGRYGKFVACSGFPECRNAHPLVKDTGGICPECGGHMLVRKSAKGRIYYGCSNYPKCNFMTWDEPVPEKCPQCGQTLFKKKGQLYCAKEGCGFTKPIEKK